MNQSPVLATPAETLDELLRVSGRGYTKVRHLLVQVSTDNVSNPGKLGSMVTERKRRSLQLFLLLLTVWPWLRSQDEPLGAAVWARALTTEKGRKWSPTNVSESWADLENRGLVDRRRLSRGVVVTPRREDGTTEYSDPGGVRGNRQETYFTLPPEFWTDGWFEELSMPGLAMLLIVGSRTSRADRVEIWLTNEDAGKWFGLSPRSVESGLSELENHGLLSERIDWVKAPLSRVGATKRHWYSLNGPFSTEARLKMQNLAKEARARRLGESTTQRVKKSKKKGRKSASKSAAEALIPSARRRTANGTTQSKSKSPGSA